MGIWEMVPVRCSTMTQKFCSVLYTNFQHSQAMDGLMKLDPDLVRAIRLTCRSPLGLLMIFFGRA